MEGDDSGEEDKKKKKEAKKKSLFKIERNYLIHQITKQALSYYQMTDKETGLNKFKYSMYAQPVGKGLSRGSSSSPTR